MMLSKSLVSFIAAFALATGVSAASTPMARDESQCSVGSVSCCDAVLPQSNPLTGLLAGILKVPLGQSVDLLGLNCIQIMSNSQW